MAVPDCRSSRHTDIAHQTIYARQRKVHADRSCTARRKTGRCLPNANEYRPRVVPLARRTNDAPRKGLMEVYGEALIEVNPNDAEKMGLIAKSFVRVTSRRGNISAQAWVTDRVPPGMIYANFHFPNASANKLTHASLDPWQRFRNTRLSPSRWNW